MHVVPEPENILTALICALEQPHTITERGGDVFIVPPPSADKNRRRSRRWPVRRSTRCAQCGGRGATIQLPGWGGKQMPAPEWPE